MQDGMEAFWGRVDDIGRARLDAEDKLHLKAADTLHRELLQELDRYCHFPFPSLVFNFLLLKTQIPARRARRSGRAPAGRSRVCSWDTQTCS
jgi:hypothetical protein